MADGDYVSVCDSEKDGRHAELNVKNVTKDPDVMEYHIEASGFYNCKSVDASMKQPWNLAEKHCFRFTVWVADGNNKIEKSVRWDQFRNYNDDHGLCYGVD